MFYVMSGINGSFELYNKALKKLGFANLDELKEGDIMDEEAVINTLEGEDVLYILGGIVGPGGDSMRILTDMMCRDNIIAVAGAAELQLAQTLKALDDHINNTGDVPPQMLVDRIVSMLGDDYASAVNEFIQLADEERELIIEYLDEISEETFLETFTRKKTYVLVPSGIRDFDPDKELDEYSAEDFTSEPLDMDKTYYGSRTIISGAPISGSTILRRNNNIAINCADAPAIYCLSDDRELYL